MAESCGKVDYICEKCKNCKDWDDLYMCCKGYDEYSNTDKWYDCGKEDILLMDEEEYYAFIIRDNTSYYMEGVEE